MFSIIYYNIISILYYNKYSLYVQEESERSLLTGEVEYLVFKDPSYFEPMVLFAIAVGVVIIMGILMMLYFSREK